MRGDSAYQHILRRNGTKQEQRQQAALQPDFFQVDEQSLEDYIRFAQRYAQSLKYFNDQNEVEGFWTAFLAGNPKEMVAYIQNPAIFDHEPEKKAWYSRPHFVLFLTFIQLLEKTKESVNQLSQRYLDFYYKEALKASPLPGKPDQVHLVAQLEEGTQELLLPKGTLLKAGMDSQGQDLFYQTTDDAFINQTQVAAIKSIYIDQEWVDYAKIRLDYTVPADRFMEVLKLVYYQPDNPKTLRIYPGDPMNVGLVEERDKLAQKIKSWGLSINAFLRIMETYHQWSGTPLPIPSVYPANYPAAGKGIHWVNIHNYFTLIKPSIEINDELDFDSNFNQAFGFNVAGEAGDGGSIFNELSGIHSIYDFYKEWKIVHLAAKREELSEEDTQLGQFLREKLKCPSTNAFEEFMESRLYIMAREEEMELRLRKAVLSKGDTSLAWPTLAYEKDKTLANAFNNSLSTDLKNDQDIIDSEADLLRLKAYFKMEPAQYFHLQELYQKEQRPNWQWQEADQLLDEAYKKLRAADSSGLMPPLSGRAKQKGLYQSADSRQIKSIPGTDRWKFFGSKPLPHLDEGIINPAEFGWGFCSPNLSLAEGERSITLDLTIQVPKGKFDGFMVDYKLEISTQKGWKIIKPEIWVKGNTDNAITDIIFFRLVLMINEKFDPIAPVDSAEYPFEYPAVRWIPLVNDTINWLEAFKVIQLKQLDCTVSVKGLKNLVIQTKEGRQKAQKPFYPFGRIPELEDQVWISHPEIVGPRLDSLDLIIEWKNFPKGEKGIAQHYKYYYEVGIVGETQKIIESPITADSFKVAASLKGLFIHFDLPNGNGYYGLFNGETTTLSIKGFDSLKAPDYERVFVTASNDLPESQRAFVLELKENDFFHAAYPKLLQIQAQKKLEKLQEKSAAIADGGDGKDKAFGAEVTTPLNPPISPIIKSISANYSTSVSLNFEPGQVKQRDFCFHYEPFGYHIPKPEAEGVSFMPTFDQAGTACIGLTGLELGAPFTLYFQLAEGSVNPDLLPVSPQWSYLSGEEWLDLLPSVEEGRDKARIISDTTRGLTNSGLIKFYLPKNVEASTMRMPGALHWLRVQAPYPVHSLPDIRACISQGLHATWLPITEDTDHLSRPLPIGTISEPASPVPGLQALSQPYPSFGGRLPEASKAVYTRMSESLRHKGRALSLWDYERLVLSHFPEVYSAKAYPGDYGLGAFEPGKVNIVVLPDISQTNLYDPKEPKISMARLRAIQHFLQERVPAYVNIEVRNPRFLYLKLRTEVRFQDMSLFEYYSEKLQKEIKEFISPWLNDPRADIVLGGKIALSRYVHFIEQKSYVDFIAQTELRLLERNAYGELEVLAEQKLETDDEDSIQSPDIIIASTETHFIENLDRIEQAIAEGTMSYKGIGHDKINYDFKIE